MPSRAELNIRARNVGINPASYPNDSKLEQRLIYEEKQSATETGAVATGTLTSDGTAPSNNDTVTIGIAGEGQKVYTFKTALTEAKAVQTITTTGNFAEGEVVSIGDVSYTFKATPDVPYSVDIGASAAISLDNLKQAINNGDTIGGNEGEGTNYGTGTNPHPLVEATTNGASTQVVQALSVGTQGNKIGVAVNGASATWGAANLAGGVDPVENEVLIGASADAALDNLKSAINASAGAGSTYSTGTDAHSEVTATTNTDTTQVVESISFNSGETIATTEAGTHTSWGAATLASGSPKVLAKDAADNAAISGGARV